MASCNDCSVFTSTASDVSTMDPAWRKSANDLVLYKLQFSGFLVLTH